MGTAAKLVYSALILASCIVGDFVAVRVGYVPGSVLGLVLGGVIGAIRPMPPASPANLDMLKLYSRRAIFAGCGVLAIVVFLVVGVLGTWIVMHLGVRHANLYVVPVLSAYGFQAFVVFTRVVFDTRKSN